MPVGGIIDLCVTVIATIFGVFDFSSKIIRLLWETFRPAINLRNIEGKRVLIVGGAGGVGSATARKLVQEGAKVALWDLDKERLDAVAAELKQGGHEVIAKVVDIRDAAAVKREADELSKEFDVDVLFNTAGYCHLFDSADDSDERIQRVLETNVNGVVWPTRAFWKRFLEKKRGHIVSMASVAGIAAVPHLNEYTATLHAVVGYMDVLEADTLARNLQEINFSVINPPFINTPMANSLRTTGNPRYPWLEAHQVADRVVQAIRARERMVTFPAEAALFCSLKSILPLRRFNLLNGRWWSYE
ncbi:Short-chain dehydrogenase [Aphelenchoides fujianensis]|nr:Short-chain dehydrogenase [Aphelenchoides fujianensis]